MGRDQHLALARVTPLLFEASTEFGLAPVPTLGGPSSQQLTSSNPPVKGAWPSADCCVSGPRFKESSFFGDRKDDGTAGLFEDCLASPLHPTQAMYPTPHQPSWQRHKELAGKPAPTRRGRRRKPQREFLWASTRRRRAAHRAWKQHASNSLFWRSWQPEGSVLQGRPEDVDSTPFQHDPAGRALGLHIGGSPRRCAKQPSSRQPSSETQPHGAKSRRTRRARNRSAKQKVPQLDHLAELLRDRPADDPQLHTAALAFAEWVEQGQLPEQSLESQLAWQVL